MSQQLLEEQISKFIKRSILQSIKKVKAVYFLSQEVVPNLPEVLGKMSEEVQKEFIDRLDKVCPNLPLFWDLWSITSAKECPPLNQQNVEYVKALGVVCSEIGRLPTSAVYSKLTKSNEILPKRGPIADFWTGRVGSNAVGIKAFHICNLEGLEETRKVSKYLTCEARSQIKFPDHSEIGSCLDETIPR